MDERSFGFIVFPSSEFEHHCKQGTAFKASHVFETAFIELNGVQNENLICRDGTELKVRQSSDSAPPAESFSALRYPSVDFICHYLTAVSHQCTL